MVCGHAGLCNSRSTAAGQVRLGQTAPVSVRKFGVEEELMLVDPDTGALAAVSHRALAAHRERAGRRGAPKEPGDDAALEQELFLQQLETGTAPCTDIAGLRADLVSCRRRAAESAAFAGAALVAVGTPVLAGSQQRVTPKPRYERIVHDFGAIGRDAGVCGMHVHVDIETQDEGVVVLDGLPPWLPVLRALSVNSPFWHGEDTGYASWRSHVWGRWPTAGPAEPFGDLATYKARSEAMIRSGAALDHGMLYYDARLSRTYPTVEIRVFDATTEIDDICLVAALSRALVQTMAQRSGDVPAWRTDLLRAAHWKASRYGVGDQLLHPLSQEPAPARTVVEDTIAHVRDALDAAGDTQAVLDGFERLLARGSGAARQRAAADSGGGLGAVLMDLRERFTASWQDG